MLAGGTGRRVLRVVVIVALCVGALLALLYLFQRRLIYQPSTQDVPAAADVLPGAREVTFRTSDGLRLAGWFVPAPDVRRAAAVLVAPGNAGDRSLRAGLAGALAERGLSVLLFDYRGYGGNEGSPTEDGLALDVRAAREFLVRQGPERLVYYGESLGAAVVTELATEHPPDALVLRSPFTDLAAVGQRQFPFLPVRLLLADEYPLAETVRRLRVPVTVVYGDADSIVPPEQSVAVAEAAGGPTTLVGVPGAGHNDAALLDGEVLVRVVTDAAR